MTHIYENEKWIEKNFKNTKLGDKRRNSRLLKVASCMLKCPQDSIPKQMNKWHDTKAAYRFFSNPEINHKAIQNGHHKNVIEEAKHTSSPLLFIQDTSSLDYTDHPSTRNIGHIGNHEGKGLMIHSCLALKLDNNHQSLLGLAAQQVWDRKHPSRVKTETKSERHKRNNESEVWKKNLRLIGNPLENNFWISVGDRTNDIFEFFDYCFKNKWAYLVRAAQNRSIEGDLEYSLDTIRSQKPVGNINIEIRRKENQGLRKITLNISFQKVDVRPPQRLQKEKEPISMWMIRCWNEEENLEWVLYTNIPINTIEEAAEKCYWYSLRWLIEEYHKCLKTGCSIEKRQLENGRALKAVLGVLAIISIRLLELKYLARQGDQLLAKDEVPKILIKIICKKVELKEEGLTLRRFWIGVAQLGGFLARKSDGDPGWQTTWKGWMELLRMWEGIELFQDMISAK